MCNKDQIISKGLLVSSNSPKKRTNEFVFTTTTNSFVRFLGEFEDTKKSFRNYLTFNECNLFISDLTTGSGTEDQKCEAIYTHSIRWLPLLLLMIYIFFFNLGYGAMIWITVAEILPLHVRSVATSLAVSFTCVCSFLTSHTYNDLKGKTKNF